MSIQLCSIYFGDFLKISYFTRRLAVFIKVVVSVFRFRKSLQVKQPRAASGAVFV